MKFKHEEIRAIFLAVLTFELGIRNSKTLVNNGKNKIVESNERLNIEKLSFKEKSFPHVKDEKPSIDFFKKFHFKIRLLTLIRNFFRINYICKN